MRTALAEQNVQASVSQLADRFAQVEAITLPHRYDLARRWQATADLLGSCNRRDDDGAPDERWMIEIKLASRRQQDERRLGAAPEAAAQSCEFGGEGRVDVGRRPQVTGSRAKRAGADHDGIRARA